MIGTANRRDQTPDSILRKRKQNIMTSNTSKDETDDASLGSVIGQEALVDTMSLSHSHSDQHIE